MNPKTLQAIAEQFEVAYIQNGGVFLALKYDHQIDSFVLDQEYSRLSRNELVDIAKRVNATYEGYKLALVVQATQLIAQKNTLGETLNKSPLISVDMVKLCH